MLTRRSLKAISTILHHSCFIKVVPFDWDPKTFTLTVITDRRGILNFTVSICVWLMCAYNIVSYYHVRNSMKVSQKVLHMVMCIVYIMTSVFTYNSLKRKNEISQFTNQFFKFQKNMDGELLLLVISYFFPLLSHMHFKEENMVSVFSPIP